MTNQQGAPEALRLAASLELCWGDSRLDEAAAELRRLHAENERLAALVEAHQPAPSAAGAVKLEPVHGDVLPPVGSRVFIRHGRDDDAHACIVTGYYAWGDLQGDKRLHRVFVRMVYEGTTIEQARMLCDCYPTAEAALAPQPAPTPQADSQPAPDEIINMAREQGLPETEIEGVFRVNADDLCRVAAAILASRATADSVTAPQQEAQEPVAWLSPWRADRVTTDYDAYGEHGIPLYTAPQPAPTQEAQEPCPTCAALARTVMLDQVSFDRKPDCYGIRQITDDEGVEEWEDIRTSPDVAREEANDMMATGRGEIYEVVPLWTTPQPSLTAKAADSVLEDAARLERERICAAIKAEDDYCVDQGDYMLDSDDCIKIVRGEWVRPDFAVDAARKQGANHD